MAIAKKNNFEEVEDGTTTNSFIDSFLSTTPTLKEEEETEDNLEELTENSEETEEEKEEQLEEEQESEELEDNNETEEEEVLEENEDFSYAPVVEFLAKEGIVEVDPEVEYEDSEEGFKGIIQETVQKETQKAIVQEYEKAFGEEAPKVLEFIQNGGNIRDFVAVQDSKIDFSEIDLSDTEEGEENKINLIIDYEVSKGASLSDAKELAEEYKVVGSLDKVAKIAVKYLEREQEKKEEFLIENQKVIAKEREKAQKEQTETFKNTIMNIETIAGFQLNKKDKEDFYNYLTKPVKHGKTQQELDNSFDRQLKQAFFNYKNYDFSDIQRKAKTDSVRSLEKNLKKFTDPNAKSIGAREINGETKKSKVSISSVLPFLSGGYND